jgi:hypothetical protein
MDALVDALMDMASLHRCTGAQVYRFTGLQVLFEIKNKIETSNGDKQVCSSDVASRRTGWHHAPPPFTPTGHLGNTPDVLPARSLFVCARGDIVGRGLCT